MGRTSQGSGETRALQRAQRRRLPHRGFRGRWSDAEVARELGRLEARDALFDRGPGREVLLPVEVTEEPFEGRDERVHWVEIEMVGEDDQPVSGVAYEVELPDGSVRRGRLGLDGRARIDGIENAGQCTVRFPALDEAAWEPIA